MLCNKPLQISYINNHNNNKDAFILFIHVYIGWVQQDSLIFLESAADGEAFLQILPGLILMSGG